MFYRLVIVPKVSGPALDPKRAPEIIARNLEAAMWEAVLYGETQVKERTPVGVFGEQGGLRGSVFGEVRGRSARELLGVVSTPLEYAEPVELGTRPHWAPIAPLVRWSEKILGLHGAEAKQAAYAIRGAIAKRGTRPRLMFRRGLAASLPKLEQMFDRMGFQIAVELSGP